MSGEKDSYDKATYGNTHAPWLSASTPVDVNLDGLREYASLMAKQQMQLAGDSAHLTHLYDTPQQAWHGKVLGEAATVREQLANNASELSAYLGYLGQAFYNIGSAAQTIADIYADGDATSAASINDVLFAFGSKDVPRPDGLPKGIGQTYLEALAAQGGTAQTGAPGESSPEWGHPTSETISPYQQMQTSPGPNGQRMEKVVTSIPGSGVTIETTTVYNARGEVLTTKTVRTTTSYDSSRHTLTTTTENTSGDRLTGSSTTTQRYDGGRVAEETTVNHDAAGRETTTSRTTTAADGSTTETSSKPVDGERKVTDRVVTGASTQGGGDTPPEKTIASAYDPVTRDGLG